MHRRWLLLVAASLLAGSPAAVQASQPTRLRVVHYYAGALQETLERLLQEFNASQSKVVVQVQYVPFGDLKRNLLVASASGDLPDVVIIDNPDTAFFAAAGVLADITERVRRWPGLGRFFEGPLNSTLLEGHQYAVPFTTNCLALFYDRAALERARIRVPATWEELRTAARKLTTQDRYGMAIAAVRSEEGTFQFLPWFLSAGATFDRLDSPGAVHALEFLRSLIADGSMSPEVIGWTQFDVQKQFSAGKAAMVLNGPWAFAQLERDAHGRNLNYAVARVPRDVKSASPLGGENVAITRQADLEAAWILVQHLTSRDFQERFARATGFLSARTDVQAGRDDPRLAVFIEAMPSVVPRGPHPRWPELSDLISGALQEGLSGSAYPRAALEKAQKSLIALRASPFSGQGATPDGR
jgi:multiple sugar transport system substrate-binding protein